MSNRVTTSCLLGLFGLALSANASGIVSTTGQVTVLNTPPASVAAGGLQSNTTAYLFQESQLILASDLNVDISQSGTYLTVPSLTPGTIGAGTPVNVYMLETDPSSVPPKPNDFRIYEGSFTFDSPVLGILVETASLRNTDALLGAPGTVYPSASDTFSGLDLNTAGCTSSSCGNDGVILSVNGNTVSFGFVTNFSEDQIRIITQATPEPSGIALMLLALLPLFAIKLGRPALRRGWTALRGNHETF